MKKSILLIFILFLGFIGHSTVMGPITIEIIGYDNQENIIYLTRTDWGECDCETDLYKYHIDKDSLEFIPNWSNRNKFRLHQQDVLNEKGLDFLAKNDFEILNKFPYKFNWLAKTEFYSPVQMKDTVNCPFQIQINNKEYEFIQCYSQNEKPIIKEYLINDSVAFLHIKYKGDCYEGNTREELILIKKKEDKIESKLLISSKKIRK